MNDRKQALEALRDKVKAGTLHEQKHGGMPMATKCYPFFGDDWISGPWSDCDCLAAYHGSLNAAKALHDAVLPDWCWSVDRMGNAVVWYPWVEGDAVSHEVSNDGQGDWSHRPACAWLIAILEALISETPKGETP